MYVLGIDPFQVDDTRQFSVGQIAANSDGNIYMYVDATSTHAAGNLVALTHTFFASNVTTTISAPAAGQGKRCGLVCATMTVDQFGWVQIFGTGVVNLNVATGCAAYTRLNSTGTSGRLDDDATADSEVIEGIVTTGAESGNEAACLLNWPYIGATL